MGRPVADCALLAAEGAAAGMVYKPVVVRYDLYIPWQGHISNKVSHEYAAGVGPSCQIPLKKELRVQVKPFFLGLRCTTINSTLVTIKVIQAIYLTWKI